MKKSVTPIETIPKEPLEESKPIGVSANPESARLRDCWQSGVPWKKWGPYLSERQWGTVREDYSSDGNAWDYFSHDQARSRAYRWGEDGLAGISDNHGVLCFALALWNGTDPILKERLFGLTNSEGNHGEDVKEYYFYLDSTPTHSYMKYLYKYPQRAYPYEDLVKTNRQRSRNEPEYELLDTRAFRSRPILRRFCRVREGGPRGSVDQNQHLQSRSRAGGPARPTDPLVSQYLVLGRRRHEAVDARLGPDGRTVIHAHHTDPLFQESLEDYYLYCEADVPLLFTENETNNARIFGSANASPYVKDGINEYIIHGKRDAVNPGRVGTKAAAHYELTVPAAQSREIRLRLTRRAPAELPNAFADFDEVS